MESNAFRCPHCHRVTRHIRISNAEFESTTGDPKFMVGFMHIMDLTGFSKALDSLTGIKPWKCCECGESHIRNLDGSIRL